MAGNTILGNGFQSADLTTCDRNIILGYRVAKNFTTNMNDNIVAGYNTANQISTNSTGNVVLGSNSLQGTSSVNNNIIVGTGNGTTLTSDSNIIVGTATGTAISTGNNNIIVGSGNVTGAALTGNFNYIVGSLAGSGLSGNSNRNIVVGQSAGAGMLTGCDDNIVMGFGAASLQPIGDANIMLGRNAGQSSTGIFANVVIGLDAGMFIADSNNVYIGYEAGNSNLVGGFGPGGFSSIGIGERAGRSVNGDYNICLGYESMGDNVTAKTGTGNIAIGLRAGYALTTPNDNVFIGENAGRQTTTGGNNVAVGFNAGRGILSGSNNLAFGQSALSNGGAATVTGARNIAIGLDSGADVSSGSDNVMAGQAAGSNITTGSNNISLGISSMGLLFDLAGDNNIAIGRQSGGNLTTTAAGNTFIGDQAGVNASTGSNNIFVGTQAGITGTGSGNICIGNTAGNVLAADTSNRLIIRSNATTIVDGDFTTNSVTTGGVTHTDGVVTQSSYTDMGELVADPATPSAGYGRLYARNDGSLKYTNDGGTTYNLTTPTSATSAEVLTADGAVSATTLYTIFNSATPLTTTLVNPTIATQKSLTTINNTQATVLLDNGELVKIAANSTVTLVYDPSLGYWTTTAGNSKQFLNQDQPGAFNTDPEATSVALNNDGNTMAIGYATAGGEYLGLVVIYTRSGSTWTEQQILKHVGSQSQGQSVALDSTGDKLLVGAPDYFTPGVGEVLYWTRAAGVWTFQSSFTPSDATGNAEFGTSVAMNSAGTICIVGGPADDTGVGACWFFNLSGVIWTQEGTKFVGTDATGAANQGYTVSMSADGIHAAMGGPANDTNRGAFWLFFNDIGFAGWYQGGNIVDIPSGLTVSGYPVSYLGSGTAINHDGSRILVMGTAIVATIPTPMFFYYKQNTWACSCIQTYNLNPTFDGNSTTYNIKCSYSGDQVIVGIPRNGFVDETNFAAILYFNEDTYNTVALTNDVDTAIDMASTVAISGDGGTYAVGGVDLPTSQGTYVKI